MYIKNPKKEVKIGLFLNNETAITMKYANTQIIDVWYITSKTLLSNIKIYQVNLNYKIKIKLNNSWK